MKILIVAGEESGEIYGAGLMREMKRLDPSLEFEGLGGDRMVAEGLTLIRHCRDMASIGLASLVKNFSFLYGVLNDVRDRVRRKLYDAVILIDYPDFNLRVARAGHEAGLPVFYYVCPQLWAWRQYRVNLVRRCVDTMLVVLPFEEDFYRERGVNARFFGHPILDAIDLHPDRAAIKRELLPEGAQTLVGLLPGSRRSEVSDILVPLLEAADAIHERLPTVGFAIPVASHISSDAVTSVVGDRKYVRVISGGSHRVMAGSDLLITKSGTSTLEAAIMGCPMLIVYRSSFLSYWLAKLLTLRHIKWAGLPNLIAGRVVAPEYLQHNFRPAVVAEKALELLRDPVKLADARREMEGVRDMLGETGGALRAADFVVGRLNELRGGAPSR